MPWLQAFKLALIKEDGASLSSLIDTLPEFDSLKDMEEAKLLISQAITFFKHIERLSSIEMQKIHKAKKYLES